MKKVWIAVFGIFIASAAFAQDVKQAPLPTAPVAQPAAPKSTPSAAAAQPEQLPGMEIPQMDAETAEALENMRAYMGHDFEGQLSFPLTEEKMIAFIRVAAKIEKINSKWDVQIAGAETDQMATEYNNFAAEEMVKVIEKLSGITQAEYTELVKLSVGSPEFSSLYRAYRQLVSEGYFGPDPTPVAETKPKEEHKPSSMTVEAPAPDVPAAPPRKAAKPPAKSSNPGKGTAPQGSPKPPYSPPAAR
jgi:hypothetical protein